MIPEGTEYVWTPAVETPRVGFVQRRAFYKIYKNVWLSWAPFTEEWVVSNNPQSWFDTEVDLGYLVDVKTFLDPSFISIKERV